MSGRGDQFHTQYTKLRVVGKGSFGEALLCRNNVTNEEVIVKRIRVRMSEKEEQESLNEVKILSRLQHPNIVRYIDSWIENNILYIVMEYADGGDLYHKMRDFRAKRQRMEETVIMDYFLQMCAALKHMHDQRILHRDLKTQNIFLTHSDTMIKLGDFGIARVLADSQDNAKTVVGTPYYLSPEICDERPYNSKSDIWALGVVLYELITFQHPFVGKNMRELMNNIQAGNYVKIQSTNVGTKYSTQLCELTAKMLQHNAADRPNINQLLKHPLCRSRMAAITQHFALNKPNPHPVAAPAAAGRLVLDDNTHLVPAKKYKPKPPVVEKRVSAEAATPIISPTALKKRERSPSNPSLLNKAASPADKYNFEDIHRGIQAQIDKVRNMVQGIEADMQKHKKDTKPDDAPQKLEKISKKDSFEMLERIRSQKAELRNNELIRKLQLSPSSSSDPIDPPAGISAGSIQREGDSRLEELLDVKRRAVVPKLLERRRSASPPPPPSSAVAPKPSARSPRSGQVESRGGSKGSRASTPPPHARKGDQKAAIDLDNVQFKFNPPTQKKSSPLGAAGASVIRNVGHVPPVGVANSNNGGSSPPISPTASPKNIAPPPRRNKELMAVPTKLEFHTVKDDIPSVNKATCGPHHTDDDEPHSLPTPPLLRKLGNIDFPVTVSPPQSPMGSDWDVFEQTIEEEVEKGGEEYEQMMESFLGTLVFVDNPEEVTEEEEEFEDQLEDLCLTLSKLQSKPGEELSLEGISPKDSQVSKSEALKMHLEEQLGFDVFVQAYKLLQAEGINSTDTINQLKVLLGPKKMSHIHLIRQLVYFEEEIFNPPATVEA